MYLNGIAIAFVVVTITVIRRVLLHALWAAGLMVGTTPKKWTNTLMLYPTEVSYYMDQQSINYRHNFLTCYKSYHYSNS